MSKLKILNAAMAGVLAITPVVSGGGGAPLTQTAPVRGNVLTANSGGGNVTSLAIPKPTGGAVGDLYVIYGFFDGGGTGSAITGWTKALGGSGTNCSIAVWYRVVDGTEGATTTIAFNGGSAEMAGYYMHFSNIDADNPIGTVGAIGGSAASGSMTVPGITTTADASIVLAVVATSNAQSTYGLSSGAGWTLRGGTLKSGAAFSDIAGTYLSNDSASAQTLADAVVTYGGSTFGNSYAEIEINGAFA